VLDTTSYLRYKSAGSDHQSDFGADDYLVAHCEFYHPISRNWQWDGGIVFRHFINKRYDPDENKYLSSGHQFNHNVVVMQSELRYIYDARTDLLLRGTLTGEWLEYSSRNKEYVFLERHLWDISQYEDRRWLMNLDGTVSYRISVPTMLQVNWSYFKQVSDTWYESAHYNGDSHGFDLSAGITHWLF
jgi:hypothetical protein